MKTIVHVIVAAAYREGYGYQENIMPKKHKQLGYNVNIITYDQGWNSSYKEMNGKSFEYINSDGVLVHVLKKNSYSMLRKIKGFRAIISNFFDSTIGLYDKLSDISPDIIFVHGIVRHDHYNIIRYVNKHPDVRLYVDNHNDYYNTDVVSIKGKIFMQYIGGMMARKLSKVAIKFWGVSPWRVRFLNDVYKIPKEKTDLLVMGGDEDLIKWNMRTNLRSEICRKYNIPNDSFIIVTGGKIDRAKNIHLLVESVKKMPENVYLLVFGKYEEDMKEYAAQIDNDRIINIGWISANKSYDLFLSSDLAVFPGTHSVLWEQACASGIPALFKDWKGGFNHVDVGGNCILLSEISVETLYNNIMSLLQDQSHFNQMKNVAENIARYVFSYSAIAKRAIEHDKYCDVSECCNCKCV